MKFMKVLLAMGDDNIMKMIINYHAFEPIINLYNLNKNKNNLIVSCFLDLIEHIKKNNLKKLISHLVIS